MDDGYYPLHYQNLFIKQIQMETPSPGLQPLYLCTRLCSSLSHSIEPGGGLAECAREEWEEETETLREYILG